eukprot:4426618-Amphidinium_carterae.1
MNSRRLPTSKFFAAPSNRSGIDPASKLRLRHTTGAYIHEGIAPVLLKGLCKYRHVKPMSGMGR